MNSQLDAGDRKVVILGALSGIAEETARDLAKKGASIALIARNPERLTELAADLNVRGAAKVATIPLDLSLTDNCDTVLQDAAQLLGGLDTVLLFYGTLGDQERAEKEHSHAADILKVNFTSAADWALAAARRFEQTPVDGAVILVASSVAGDRGRRSNFVYGAAKGGLSILMQGLAHKFAALPEPRPRAIVAKLGFVDTPMTAHIAKKGALWAQPEDVAQKLVAALDKSAPVIYVPGIWRLIMLIIRTVPSAIFNKVNL